MQIKLGVDGAGPVKLFVDDYVSLIVGDTEYRIRVLGKDEGGDGQVLQINKSATTRGDFQLVVLPQSSNVICIK